MPTRHFRQSLAIVVSVNDSFLGGQPAAHDIKLTPSFYSLASFGDATAVRIERQNLSDAFPDDRRSDRERVSHFLAAE